MPRPLVVLDLAGTLCPRLRADHRLAGREVIDVGGYPPPERLEATLQQFPDALVLLNVEPDFELAWSYLRTLREQPQGRDRSVLLVRQSAANRPPAYVAVSVLDLSGPGGLAPLVAALTALER